MEGGKVKPHGIIVFGPNGSGKTTLGRELARVLGCKHIDHEDYAFAPSEIPYATPRSDEDCVKLMLADIGAHGAFVMSTVVGDYCEEIVGMCDLAVYISAPLDLRLERIARRGYERFGDRVLKGGDMYEQQLKFAEFVAARPISRVDIWAETLTCPLIRIDGTGDWREGAAEIAGRYRDIMGAAT